MQQQNTNNASKTQLLEQLERNHRPVDLEELVSWTGQTETQLRGFMGDLVASGQVQKIGKNHYRFIGAPIPAEGESFSGKVTGTSYKGGFVLSDSNGTSWRVEPI